MRHLAYIVVLLNLLALPPYLWGQVDDSYPALVRPGTTQQLLLAQQQALQDSLLKLLAPLQSVADLTAESWQLYFANLGNPKQHEFNILALQWRYIQHQLLEIDLTDQLAAEPELTPTIQPIINFNRVLAYFETRQPMGKVVWDIDRKNNALWRIVISATAYGLFRYHGATVISIPLKQLIQNLHVQSQNPLIYVQQQKSALETLAGQWQYLTQAMQRGEPIASALQQLPALPVQRGATATLAMEQAMSRTQYLARMQYLQDLTSQGRSNIALRDFIDQQFNSIHAGPDGIERHTKLINELKLLITGGENKATLFPSTQRLTRLTNAARRKSYEPLAAQLNDFIPNSTKIIDCEATVEQLQLNMRGLQTAKTEFMSFARRLNPSGIVLRRLVIQPATLAMLIIAIPQFTNKINQAEVEAAKTWSEQHINELRRALDLLAEEPISNAQLIDNFNATKYQLLKLVDISGLNLPSSLEVMLTPQLPSEVIYNYLIQPQ